MKPTIKLFLVVILFCSAAFAEGDMGTGGRSCPDETTTCLVVAEPCETKETANDTEDSIFSPVREYLEWILQIFGKTGYE
jgi:hypothetical protein